MRGNNRDSLAMDRRSRGSTAGAEQRREQRGRHGVAVQDLAALGPFTVARPTRDAEEGQAHAGDPHVARPRRARLAGQPGRPPEDPSLHMLRVSCERVHVVDIGRVDPTVKTSPCSLVIGSGLRVSVLSSTPFS